MTTPQSAGLEQRARELLAAEYERDGEVTAPESVRKDELASLTGFQQRAIRAIEAALAAPAADGVLVPREIVENYAQSTLIPRHKRICEAALAALAAAPAADGWRPIESAPRGSRKVIALISIDGPNGYVSDPWTGWIDSAGVAARWPHDFPPTHWMPLPAAPQAQGEGA